MQPPQPPQGDPPPQTPPPMTPPTYAPPVYNGPKGSPRKNGLSIVAAVVGFAVVFGLFSMAPRLINRVRPSGVTIDGKSVSEAEAREGVKEMMEMARGAKAGDPTSLNLDAEPKTALGKRFKAIALKSAMVEKTYTDSLGGRGVADLITPERMTSQAGRDKSREELKTLDKAATVYFADTAAVAEEMYGLFSGASASAETQAAALRDETHASGEAMKELIAIAGKMIDFSDKAKPTLQGSSSVFRTSADVKGYNELADAFNAKSQAFVKALQESLKARQEKMNAAVSKMDSGALD